MNTPTPEPIPSFVHLAGELMTAPHGLREPALSLIVEHYPKAPVALLSDWAIRSVQSDSEVFDVSYDDTTDAKSSEG